jgi:DNA-binding transcriptional LysR family regulator
MIPEDDKVLLSSSPMRYTISEAEAFYRVARLGSFRAAADHLSLTQPTVSLRIKELERVFGGELFDRTTYRPLPTPLGTAIFGDVERMLAQADFVQQRVKGAVPGGGLLRIGAGDTFAMRILPDLLAELASSHPALKITATVDLSIRLEQLLLERAIDIAFLSDPRVNEGIRVVPIWSVDFAWVIGKSLAFEGSLATPENLEHLPIFTNGLPSSLHTTMQFWFGLRGLTPRHINICNNLPVIARLANAGTGAALVPRDILELCGHDLSLRVLDADPPVPTHNICATWREGAAEAAECAYLAEVAQRLIRHDLGARQNRPKALPTIA